MCCKKGYGEICQLDKECIQAKSGRIICDEEEKKCKCETGTLRHPDFPGKCAISAEKRKGCDVHEDNCVPNAKCIYKYCECVDNTVMSRSIKGVTGYCFVRKGDSCFGDMRSPITNRTCLRGLLCKNGRCSCLYDSHQEYDEQEEKCSTLINGPCYRSSDCTDNSECIDDYGLKVCRCKEGFSAVDRKCDLAYGESCAQGQRYPKGDRIGPLQCIAM